MISAHDIPQAQKLWQNASSIVIITHEKPDGDAIASLIALGDLLQKQTTASIRLVCCDETPEAFRFLPNSSDIQHDFFGGDADLIITVDCGDVRRTGFADRLVQLVAHGID